MIAAAESLWAAERIDAFWSCIESGLATARAQGDSALLAELLALRGQARARLGRIRDAEPDLRAAIRMTGPGTDARRTLRGSLRWLAYALGRRGENSESLETWERLMTLSRASADRFHEAWAWGGIGFLSWQDGRSKEAEAQYEQALLLFREEGDERGEAFVTNGLGTVAQALGDYQRAEKEYRTAAAKAHACGWAWLEALAWNNLAVLLFLLGDPGQAGDMFRRAADLHRRAGDIAEAAVTGENIARCEAALGRFEEGIAEVRRIREECHAHGIRQLDGGLSNALAEIREAQGCWHSASALFREALAQGEKAAARDRREAVLGLVRVLVAVDSLELALSVLEDAAPWFRGGNPLAQLEFDVALGWCDLLAGRSVEALSLLAAAEREAFRLGQRAVCIRALLAESRAARRLGMPDSALACLRRALSLWEAERGLPADPEWREIRGASAAEIVADLGLTLLRTNRSEPLPLETPSPGPLGPEPLLAGPTEPTFAASAHLESTAERRPDACARRAFDALQGYKARTLMERMLGPAGEETPPVAVDVVDCAALQRSVLMPGELLVDFYLGADTSLVFAVDDRECRGYRIPGRTELESILLPYLRMVTAPLDGADDLDQSAEDLRAVSRRVRDLLLGPALDLVHGHQSLIFVPDGVLGRVSFAALLEADAPTSSPPPPVVQVVPSASILARMRREDAGASRGASVPWRIAALAPAGSGAISVDARREVKDVAACVRGVDLRPAGPRAPRGIARAPSGDAPPAAGNADAFRLSQDATSGFLDVLSSYDVLHFAAHATVDEDHPWCARILLGGDSAGVRDALTASSIVHSRLRARLAVLSACRTAGGRILAGEGTQGPASAFLVAGVPAVVAALWPVDGADTRRLMGRFYDALTRGATIAEALSRAQADLRSNPGSRHPSHWAGFIVMGDGSLRVPLERRSPLRRFVLPAILLLAGVTTVLGPALRRRLRGSPAGFPCDFRERRSFS